MAIVFGIEKFKIYFFGREFIARTDQRPLQWLKGLSNPSPRLARWLLKARKFDSKIEFKSGNKNVVADALSRYFIYGDEDEKEDDIEPGIILNNTRLQVENSETLDLEVDEDIMTFKECIRENR